MFKFVFIRYINKLCKTILNFLNKFNGWLVGICLGMRKDISITKYMQTTGGIKNSLPLILKK